MNDEKRKALEAAGYKFGDAEDFLNEGRTMNVDDAIAYASKDKCFWTGEVHTALETLAAEVKRLRAELAAAMAEIESVIRLGPHPVEQVQMPLATFVETRFVPVWQYNELADKLERTQAELAAAKAASELPVQVIDCYSFGDDVEVVCKCGDDADRLSGWIRERMKENSI